MGKNTLLQHEWIVLVAFNSFKNTSNPNSIIATGLLAKIGTEKETRLNHS